MTTFRSSLALLIALLWSGTSSSMSKPIAPGAISISGHLNTNCISHNGGTAYLQLDVSAYGFQRDDHTSAPMNLAVVLDRSGSMADDGKMSNAKKAIDKLLDRLTPNDYLSIIIYDDVVETILPLQQFRDRREARHMVDEIFPRGSTNLGGGLEEGYRQIERGFKRGYVNRVLLLSDGLANRGITDQATLSRIASEHRSRSISLSTIGVGLDYNENLMLALATGGGGNYYFVESPSQLSSIFERELHSMNRVVAYNASIELTLGRGVSFVDAIGCDRRMESSRWIIPLGDISADDHRSVTVELTIPEGAGSLHVADATLMGSDQRLGSCSVDIRYSDDAAELKKGKDWETQGKVDVALSTRSVENAMRDLDAGRADQAAAKLQEASAALRASGSMMNAPAMAPAIQSQIDHLEEVAKDLKSPAADQRKVKKQMQYRNYQTQKSKP